MHNVQADGATPLYGASWNGRVEVLQTLLRAGADVNQAMVSCERKRACYLSETSYAIMIAA